MITRTMYVLAVPDLERSAAFYRDVLGFEVREIGDPGWRIFEKDVCRIMAGECPDATPAAELGDHSYFAYLTVEGVDDYYRRAREHGVALIKPLRDEPWGMREFGLYTVDGHRMMIGSEQAVSPAPGEVAPGEAANLALLRSYLAALEAGAVGDDLARFFTADAEQVELPNRLNPNGGRSDLATMLSRAEQGRKLLAAQRYIVHRAVASGSMVAMEAEWTGVLAVALGSLPPGAEMRAHLAMFFDIDDGRIRTQRNYDCFEPW